MADAFVRYEDDGERKVVRFSVPRGPDEYARMRVLLAEAAAAMSKADELEEKSSDGADTQHSIDPQGDGADRGDT